ncbi:MAG: nucleotidyltransferase substrate binding protein [Bdellovibrionales bacterium]|nr:nucleotidyltransferase substrate binding protein [Bdellovibrionales bacterium]
MKSHKFSNFLIALSALEEACKESIKNDRDVAGIIMSFEFAYELSWNALKEVLANQGIATTTSRDVFAKAYQSQFIHTDSEWIELMNDRNRTSHTYDKGFARQMVERIKLRHFPLLLKLRENLSSFGKQVAKT